MKAIIFDIDGTLIESMEADTALYLSSITDVLGPVSIRDLGDYDHVTDDGILAQVFEDNGHSFDANTVASVKATFLRKLEEHLDDIGSYPVIEGAIEFMNRVNASDNHCTAIATGGWRESARLKLDSAGFDLKGIPLATSDDATSRVEIMRLALAKAGADASSVTYFGDAEWDRRACQDLDWNFVAVGPELDGIDSYLNIRL